MVKTILHNISWCPEAENRDFESDSAHNEKDYKRDFSAAVYALHLKDRFSLRYAYIWNACGYCSSCINEDISRRFSWVVALQLVLSMIEGSEFCIESISANIITKHHWQDTFIFPTSWNGLYV